MIQGDGMTSVPCKSTWQALDRTVSAISTEHLEPSVAVELTMAISAVGFRVSTPIEKSPVCGFTPAQASALGPYPPTVMSACPVKLTNATAAQFTGRATSGLAASPDPASGCTIGVITGSSPAPQPATKRATTTAVVRMAQRIGLLAGARKLNARAVRA